MYYIVAFTSNEVADMKLHWKFQNQLEDIIEKEKIKKVEWTQRGIPYNEVDLFVYSAIVFYGDYEVFMYLNEAAKKLASDNGISARFIGQALDIDVVGLAQKIKCRIPIKNTK